MAQAVANPPKLSPMELVKKVTTIGTLPEVTSRIISTVEDPRSSAAQLHRIVAHDPALVARVLKVVNSAFYGLPGQIGSIDRAIVLLGLNAVKNIAVAASLGQLFRGAKLANGLSAKDLWTHCIAVAVTARDLAQQNKLPIADEAFLAGMIHDLGILVSLQTAPEAIGRVCDMAVAAAVAAKTGLPSKSFCDLERQEVGFDHQQLGQALAEHWKFPHACQLVAGHHHQPSALVDAQKQLVGVVWAADTLCCHSKHGFTLTAASQALDPKTLQSFGMDPNLVEGTQSRLDDLIANAAAFLG